ncbi:hypothetical protein [Brevundimonas goettingensis]|uniref:hypothetical protein n=1 Tax=Brevundimonas goettingensis TaxID=2774190 RepID=UPI001A9E68F6|nr:hypothetical protein [Brevundimonas goettingensis]
MAGLKADARTTGANASNSDFVFMIIPRIKNRSTSPWNKKDNQRLTEHSFAVEFDFN